MAATFLFSSCAPYQARRNGVNYKAHGTASWYGPGFKGRKTASGERYDPSQMTAAHRTLPFGTTVKVLNVENGKSTVVRINDRGPFIRGRIIDLSKAAAKHIQMMGPGTARVRLMALSGPEGEKESPEAGMEVKKKKRGQPPEPAQSIPSSPPSRTIKINPPPDPSESGEMLRQQEDDIKEKTGMPGEVDRF